MLHHEIERDRHSSAVGESKSVASWVKCSEILSLIV